MFALIFLGIINSIDPGLFDLFSGLGILFFFMFDAMFGFWFFFCAGLAITDTGADFEQLLKHPLSFKEFREVFDNLNLVGAIISYTLFWLSFGITLTALLLLFALCRKLFLKK